jgi:hypothetical protein
MAKGLQVEQFLAGWTDGVGQPLAGGKVFSYAAGTNTLQPLYNDKDCLNAATNPVILDSNGRAQVYANSSLSYKFVVKTSADVTLYTLDHLFYPREALFSDSGSGYNITNTTSDGSDTKRLLFNGGGGSGSGRGAEIQLHGNESAGNTGVATISSGNISAATVDLNIIPANGKLRIVLNGVSRWEFDATTNSLLPTATNLYDIGSSSFRTRNVFAQALNSASARGAVYASSMDCQSITMGSQSWTPNGANYTFSDGNGTMTWTSGPTFQSSSYFQIGKITHFWHRFLGVFGGTAQATINFPLPLPAASINQGSFYGMYDILNYGVYSASVFMGDVNTLRIRREGGVDWLIGYQITFIIGGTYVAA